MSSNSEKNKRIAKNTMFLYIRMFFVMLVGLYTSRVILNVLGVSDYGLYNVVGGFVSLFAFLNSTLAASMARFYNFEGGKEGEEGYIKVFSIGIRVHLILALIVFIILETLGVWYINNVMVLPEDRLPAAHLLYQFSIASMLMTIIQIPYKSVVISKEKLGFYAFLDILDVVLHLVIVLILPYLPLDKLIIYAILQFALKVLNFLLNIIYANRKFRYLRPTRHIDKSMLKEMFSFSSWTLLGTMAFMAKGQGLNLLLNAFFGTVVNAARAVAFQINTAVMRFSSNITMSFEPQLVSSYAAGDIRRSFSLFYVQSKLCFSLILMLITPLIIEVDYLLKIWLGEAVPEYTNVFASLVLIDSMVCTLNTPVTQIVFATGNIKRYQIANSIVNLQLLPFCWLFLRFGGEPWVVFMTTIAFSLINQIVCLVEMHRVVDFKYSDYIKRIAIPCLSLLILVPVIPYMITKLMDSSFLRLMLVSIMSILITALLQYGLFMTNTERQVVNLYVKKLVHKK